MNLKKLTATVGAVALAAGLAACGGSGSDSADAGTMQVMMFPSVAYRLPIVIAQDKGFFADKGLMLNFVATPNNLQGVQAIEATKSQAGFMAMATFGQGVQAGSDVQAFCGGIDVTQSSILAKADSELPSVHDGATPEQVFAALKGKKFGATTPIGSGFQIMTQKGMEDGGATGMTYVNVGGSNSITQASLDNGSIDVAQATPSGTQQMVVSGAAKELLYMPDVSDMFGTELYGSAWVAPTAWLERNPASAKAFCEGAKEGMDYIRDPENHDEVVKISQKDSGISDPKVTDAVLKTYDDYSTDIPIDAMQRTFDTFVDLKILQPEPYLDATKLVNNLGE